MLNHAASSDEPGKEGVLFIPLQVTDLGTYKLQHVVDNAGDEVRIHRSEAIVVDCPTAEISSFNELEGHFCQGETDALKVTVRGVPPLHLTYVQYVNEQ